MAIEDEVVGGNRFVSIYVWYDGLDLLEAFQLGFLDDLLEDFVAMHGEVVDIGKSVVWGGYVVRLVERAPGGRWYVVC